MALKYKFAKHFQGVSLKSGHIYNFAYSGYQHDPAPLVIFLWWVEGFHPRTKRQWRFIQCLNLNYLSRGYRKQFVEKWTETLYRTRDLKLTWQQVQTRFPEMAFATRRYFYSPKYYINSLRAIEEQDVEKEVVGSLYKDYSKQARIAMWTQLRKLQRTIPTILGTRRGRH
jgi:hypothetical protein